MTLNLNLQTAKVHVSLSLIDDIIHNVLEIAMKMHLGKFWNLLKKLLYFNQIRIYIWTVKKNKFFFRLNY